MKISFVCPIFNKRKYLPDVVSSIKNQIGDFESEFIFVDDGSVDGSLDLVKSLTRNWSNVLYLQHPNKGPAFSTQRGIEKATGDYLKLVGGDDVMLDNCVNILLKTIKKDSSVAAFSNYELTNEFNTSKFSNCTKLKDYKIISNPVEQTLISCFSGTTPNLYCNKSVKMSGGCYKNLFVEDFSLVLKLSKFGSFSFINNLTSLGPKDDPNRIMVGNEKQLIHDYNATVFYFIQENPDISKTIKKKACIKALGRTEKWIRRVLKKKIFNEINYLRIKYFLNQRNEIDFIRRCCEIFYSSKYKTDTEIRYKIKI